MWICRGSELEYPDPHVMDGNRKGTRSFAPAPMQGPVIITDLALKEAPQDLLILVILGLQDTSKREET